MPTDRHGKLTRRAIRATTAAMATLGNNSYGVNWLAVARLTVTLADDDIIAVGHGSAFGRAFDTMVASGLGAVNGEQEAALAEELAVKLRRALNSQGLFV